MVTEPPASHFCDDCIRSMMMVATETIGMVEREIKVEDMIDRTRLSWRGQPICMIYPHAPTTSTDDDGRKILKDIYAIPEEQCRHISLSARLRNELFKIHGIKGK